MKHRYLSLDGEIHGTGLKDQYEGFIELDEVPLSQMLKNEISVWANEYHEMFGQTLDSNDTNIHELDIRGLNLMRRVSEELGPGYKVRYYSDLMTKELRISKDGDILEL